MGEQELLIQAALGLGGREARLSDLPSLSGWVNCPIVKPREHL